MKIFLKIIFQILIFLIGIFLGGSEIGIGIEYVVNSSYLNAGIVFDSAIMTFITVGYSWVMLSKTE